MTRFYEVYRNDAREHLAIPVGFSWMAALLDWIWALWLRLWGIAVVLLVINVVIGGVLYVNRADGLTYAIAQILQGLSVGFAARRLRELSAERRGYAYLATIPATDGPNAIAKLGAVGGQPLPEWKPRHLFGVPDLVPPAVRGMLAMALLTLRAAFRYRLVVALLGLLIAVVFILPTIIKHDGSAQGFTQILITYTLTAITALMGFATLWLACGTIARDIEDMQLFLVAVKPIPRWQIWLGKWLGIMALNAAMVALSGAVVYGLIQWRTSELRPDQRRKLSEEVLVARSSIREPVPDIRRDVEIILAERLKESSVAAMDRAFVRKQIEEGLKARNQVVPPGNLRRWQFQLGSGAAERLKDRPLFLRVKFFTSQYNSEGTLYPAFWEVGPPDGRRARLENSLPAESFVEFAIPPNLVEPSGQLTVDFQNWTEQPLLFPLEDGLEALYHDGGFFMNFVRGLMVIVFWLGLLTAIGLACSSFLNFPVAAFCSLSVLLLSLSGGTLKQVVEQGGIMDVDHETGQVSKESFVNQVSVVIYGNAKRLIDQISGYSPVTYLSTGRSITWRELLHAAIAINGIAGGLVMATGMLILTRRELAAPTKF
jgi:hypothetical protein